MTKTEIVSTIISIVTAITLGFAAPVLLPVSGLLGIVAIVLCVLWSLAALTMILTH